MIKVLVLVLFCSAALVSCSAGGIAHEFYVVIEPDQAPKLFAEVKAIAKQEGLEIAEARIVADTGDTLVVLEGRVRGMRLWVQSTTLSGKEDPKLCGEFSEPHSDPAQFTVFTEPRFFGSRESAKRMGERIHSELQKAGFDIRQQPAVCGAAALRDRS